MTERGRQRIVRSVARMASRPRSWGASPGERLDFRATERSDEARSERGPSFFEGSLDAAVAAALRLGVAPDDQAERRAGRAAKRDVPAAVQSDKSSFAKALVVAGR
jgi:hypothetical protein